VGLEDLFLALEVVVERALRAADLGRDGRHRGGVEAFFQEHLGGDVEDRLAAGVAIQAGFDVVVMHELFPTVRYGRLDYSAAEAYLHSSI
jgi:predicted nucleic acid-binding protein